MLEQKLIDEYCNIYTFLTNSDKPEKFIVFLPRFKYNKENAGVMSTIYNKNVFNEKIDGKRKDYAMAKNERYIKDLVLGLPAETVEPIIWKCGCVTEKKARWD